MGNCEVTACPEGDCIESDFPSLMHGRSVEEIQYLANILKKIADGDGAGVSNEDRMFADALTSDDIAEVEFNEIISNANQDKDERRVPTFLTVKVLRGIYKQ